MARRKGWRGDRSAGHYFMAVKGVAHALLNEQNLSVAHGRERLSGEYSIKQYLLRVEAKSIVLCRNPRNHCPSGAYQTS